MPNDVVAVGWMYLRRVQRHGCFRIDDMGCLLVLDEDHLGGVLRQGTSVSDHGHHPFTGVAYDALGQRIACHLGRIHSGQHWLDSLV